MERTFLRRIVFVTLAMYGTISSAYGQTWPNSIVGRLAALAIVQTLNSDLLSHDSATLTLDRWCADHKLSDRPVIVAHLDNSTVKAATTEQRRLLAVGPDEPIKYRHVQLVCGSKVLSEADNWYVPSRLAPEMNNALDSSNIAFGRAVQGLRFQRHTVAAKLLWSPLAEGWEMRPLELDDPTKALIVPASVLRHEAILTLPDGTPFSEVVETYTSQVLAFPAPVVSSTPN